MSVPETGNGSENDSGDDANGSPDESANEPIFEPANEPTSEMGEMPPTPPPYKSKSTWLRGLYMILFAIAIEIAEILLGFSALLQWFWLLFTGHPNGHVKRFGQSLSLWLRDAARFQSCASDDKPFPWADWPKAE